MSRYLLLVLVLLMASPAVAGTLSGVTMPDSVTVNGKNLVLNGMGLRKKFVIKVYVAGLYLPAKQSSGEKILSADTERSLQMHYVYYVEKGKICRAWNKALKSNSPDKAEALKAKYETLCSYMADMDEGETMTFTYVPGKGTTISVNGKAKGTIAGKDFADALFASWVGPNPPGEDFKQGLLGG